MEILTFLGQAREKVDSWLSECLPQPESQSQPLFEAMRYSLLGGGKRLRPILLVSTAEVFGDGQSPLVKDFACAVECLHTYSLIHDDLPSMDNDALRRGRPTCHIKFGEALAILAGDALLTLAFELMSRPHGGHGAAQLAALNVIARRAGCLGMVGGQTADILADALRTTAAQVQFIHQRKTAALISASIEAGAILADAGRRDVDRLCAFGERIGLAFQIMDDVLESEGDSETLGKDTQSDVRNRRATYPAIIGTEAARAEAVSLVEEACSLLDPFGSRAEVLRGIARYFLHRKS